MIQIILSAIGGLIAGAGLWWAIYHWVLDRRDKAHAEEVRQMYETFWKSEERTERVFKGLGDRLDDLTDKIAGMIADLREHSLKREHLESKFLEYVTRVNIVMDHHEAKLENIGKVIYAWEKKNGG